MFPFSSLTILGYILQNIKSSCVLPNHMPQWPLLGKVKQKGKAVPVTGHEGVRG
jgi:hypothetical protein